MAFLKLTFIHFTKGYLFVLLNSVASDSFKRIMIMIIIFHIIFIEV